MNTQPLTVHTLRSSVIAVPPLARNQDLSLNRTENLRLVRHVEAGGVSTILYGGNANLYHVALSEYRELLALICDVAADETLVIPSVGPAYGIMLDQATILREFPFPTAMILPHREIATSPGVARAARDFAQASKRPVVLYIKHDNYIHTDDVQRLVKDDLLAAIKYAVVRDNPLKDDYLRSLIDAVGPDLIVSGMGEQPAIAHLREFGLPGFTSGCVCVRPDLSMQMLRAVQQGDYDTAENLKRIFEPLEGLRNAIHPIRVLHAAVTLGEIAHTGPLLPCLSTLDTADHDAVLQATRQLQSV